MAAASTLSFGIISTICSLFAADEAPYEQIEYRTPMAVHGQLAASMSKPGEVDVLAEVRSLEPGGIRLVAITNIGDLPCPPDAGSMPEIGFRIGTTALEGILEAAVANDDQTNRRGRLAYICRVNVAGSRTPKRAARLPLPDQVGASTGVRRSLSAVAHLNAWPRMRAADMALLEITFDQIRRRLDTPTVEIVTGKKVPNPRAGMMILEGI